MSDGSEREFDVRSSCAWATSVCEVDFSNTFNSSVAADARMSMFMVELDADLSAGRCGTSSFTFMSGLWPARDGEVLDTGDCPACGADLEMDADDEEDDDESRLTPGEELRTGAGCSMAGANWAADWLLNIGWLGNVGDSGDSSEPADLDKFLFRRLLGLVWMREWRVSSSRREKRLLQPGKEQEWGFSPVWVRICRVWCSKRWKALSHMGHLYGLEVKSLRFESGFVVIMVRVGTDVL